MIERADLWEVMPSRTAYDILGHGAIVWAYFEVNPPNSAEPVRVLRSDGMGRKVVLTGTNSPQFLVTDVIR